MCEVKLPMHIILNTQQTQSDFHGGNTMRWEYFTSAGTKEAANEKIDGAQFKTKIENCLEAADYTIPKFLHQLLAGEQFEN